EMAVTLTETGARQAVDRFLELSPRPTALYCFNNSFARLLIAELQRRGLEVPGDVSVVGGGGEEVPGLSWPQGDWLGMGPRAMQGRVRPVAGGKTAAPEHHRLPHVPRPGQTAAPRPSA